MAYFPDWSPSFQTWMRELAQRPAAVLGHVRPDGDCIGSQLALCRVLRALGGEAICVNRHRVPPYALTFVGDTPFFRDDEAPLDGRVAVSVDCADRRRLGETLDRAFPEIFLNVDHHISNSQFARHNLVIGSAAAAAEILAGLFLDAGYPIDAVTAQALYIGIATDTGQFRFSSTTQRCFRICSELMDRGADPATAARHLYEQESPAKLALLQRFLASFSYHCSGRVCLGQLTDHDWAASGASPEDTEGLVDYARAIAGVEIGVLLEERHGRCKGSFRCKDPIHRVDELARAFGGGGHACAAGFNPDLPLPELRRQVLAALEAHFARFDRQLALRA